MIILVMVKHSSRNFHSSTRPPCPGGICQRVWFSFVQEGLKRSVRKHGLSTEPVPVSAYVGSSKNLKDLRSGHRIKAVFETVGQVLSVTCSIEDRADEKWPVRAAARNVRSLGVSRGSKIPLGRMLGELKPERT